VVVLCCMQGKGAGNAFGELGSRFWGLRVGVGIGIEDASTPFGTRSPSPDPGMFLSTLHSMCATCATGAPRKGLTE
jgi:hypothetical protein